MPLNAFFLKIQRELYHSKCARKVSGLSRNGPLVRMKFELTNQDPADGENFTVLTSMHVNRKDIEIGVVS